MALKKWDKLNRRQMGAYFPDKGKDKNDNILEFPKDLSPLTNFSLDIFVNTISKKNLIINYPQFKLGPANIFAYLFSQKYNQSVYLLASNKESMVSHNKNHYLLSDYKQFIFHFLPVFYLKKLTKNSKNYQKNPIPYNLSLEKYLPRAKLSFKKKYTEEAVLKIDHPKFIIDNDSRLFAIKEKLSIILKNNDKYINPETHPIGLIIIENADRFFRSYERLKNFIVWFKKLDTNIKLLIHFNNPYSEYIKILIKELNCYVLPFNRYILENNTYLKNISKEYFDHIEFNKLKLLNNYNLDHNLTKKLNISIYEPLIDNGLIDTYFRDAYIIFKKIDLTTVFNQSSIHKSRELMFNLYNLTVNPSYLKILFRISTNNWIYGTIPQFIKTFKSKSYSENPKNRLLIQSFLDSLSNIYHELSKCKRVNEDLSYSRKAKDYVLYELLLELFKKGEKVFVGTYMDTEHTILEEILIKGEINLKDITPINMKTLIRKSNDEKEGKILVLPGIIPEVFVSELFKPYKEIIILSYDGNNYNLLKEQLNQIIYGNILEEKEYMDYLNNILETFDSNEDNGILNDFYERFNKIEFKSSDYEDGELTKSEDEEVINCPEILEDEDSNINNIFSIDLNLNEYMSEWGKSKSNLNIDLSSEIKEKMYNTIPFKLQNIKTKEFVEKELPINKSYLTFDNIHNIDEAKELKPSELNSGNYIIIIDNDEKKSLLNLVIDVSNFKSQINTDLVEYWKVEFLSYIESHNLKYTEVYNIYSNNGGDKTYQSVMKWGKGETIGPQSADDLYIIGKIMNNAFIMENYKLIFQQINLVRTTHRLLGRKLKKMIKSILTDEYLEVSTLTENEYLIYENIQNGIYKIL